jgi:hypothetical protein
VGIQWDDAKVRETGSQVESWEAEFVKLLCQNLSKSNQ